MTAKISALLFFILWYGGASFAAEARSSVPAFA